MRGRHVMMGYLKEEGKVRVASPDCHTLCARCDAQPTHRTPPGLPRPFEPAHPHACLRSLMAASGGRPAASSRPQRRSTRRGSCIRETWAR
jgi:hypothetical protein